MPKDELISLINESKSIKNKTLKDIKNLRKLKRGSGIKYKVLGNIKNFRSLENNKSINDRLFRYIRTLCESDEEDYHKAIRTGNAFSSNYIEYEGNGDRYR